MSTQGRHAIAADCAFDGTVVHRNAAVVIDGPQIIALMPRADVPADLAAELNAAGS